MQLEEYESDNTLRILKKIGYHGFWVIFFLRFVGFYVSYRLFLSERYIFFILLLIVSVPSFEYTCTYIKHIKKLLQRIKPVAKSEFT